MIEPLLILALVLGAVLYIAAPLFAAAPPPPTTAPHPAATGTPTPDA